ncbi:MAG: YciI family protein [Bacteroidota bacterium]
MNWIKNLSFILLSLTLTYCNSTDSNLEITNAPEESTSGYDSLLANKLGADDYGMSQYVMAFLLAGDSVNIDSARRVDLSRGHMANIRRMAKNGDLVLAGPFLDGGELRGIYIFDVQTIEEAQALTNTDPAVQAGVFKFEMHPWYGTAALKQVTEVGQRIRKLKP